jgi:hypothetical protein
MGMTDRKHITVMTGETPLYDASITREGDVFVEQLYQQPAERPVRYGRVQLADVERGTAIMFDQSGHGNHAIAYARMRLRCGRCGHDRDHAIGEPLPPCPGACGATANPIIER